MDESSNEKNYFLKNLVFCRKQKQWQEGCGQVFLSYTNHTTVPKAVMLVAHKEWLLFSLKNVAQKNGNLCAWLEFWKSHEPKNNHIWSDQNPASVSIVSLTLPVLFPCYSTCISIMTRICSKIKTLLPKHTVKDILPFSAPKNLQSETGRISKLLELTLLP